MVVSYRDQRICSKESLITLLLIIALVRKVTTFPVNTPTCKDGQKPRTDSNGLHICCNIVVCNKSQDFDFCLADQGHDFCKDCPTGTYSNDAVNTSMWDNSNKVDVCVPKPECNADEVILEGNACKCNLANGHWGQDPNNCQLDKKNCKDAGQELHLDGKCKPCPNNKFKPESGVYGTCREKRSCNQDEEEIDSGSTDTDRTCRKKITVETTTTVTVPTPTTGPVDPKGDEENGVPSYIYWLLPLIIILILALLLGYRFRKKLKELTERRCCQRPEIDPVLMEEGELMLPQNGLPVQQNGTNKLKDDKGEVHKNGRIKKNPVESEDNSFHDSLDGRNRNGHPIQAEDGSDSGDGDQTNLKGQEADDDNSLPTNTTDLSVTGQNHGNNDDQGNVNTNTIEENFPSLGSSIYDNVHSSQIDQNGGLITGNRFMSSPEANIPPLNTSRSSPAASIPQQAHTLPTNETSDEITQEKSRFSMAESRSNGNIPQDENTQEKSVYDTAESGAHGNIPGSNLFHSLTTRTDNSSTGVFHTALAANDCNGDSNQQEKENEAEIGQQNNRDRKVQLPRYEEIKDRPKAKVLPIPRTPSTENPNQENPANNANPPAATTTFGQEVQQATNEENHKVVANAEYPAEWRQPLNVDMSGRGNDGNGEDNQSSSQDEHGESINDDYVQVVQVVPVTGVESQSAANPRYNRTTSGNVMAAPESENSQESSTSNESSLQHDTENGTSSTGAPDEDRTGES